eukprot:3517693-Alexandrium_andersonii.AAC.1
MTASNGDEIQIEALVPLKTLPNYTRSDAGNLLNAKQNTLTAGLNINIDNDTRSTPTAINGLTNVTTGDLTAEQAGATCYTSPIPPCLPRTTSVADEDM